MLKRVKTTKKNTQGDSFNTFWCGFIALKSIWIGREKLTVPGNGGEQEERCRVAI
ncbi:hypothetical protein J2W55_003273 [Mucilaginibacter pocheonensis]|uniref:Uncharacterized protein n=1 Tax=Mucilaginibacter pocheonensis TaxID=398050 RepID=A0ABU1TDF9_9SPHI|nr:hypothetical protein [Mucilaginibacter pocheonensis]